MSGLTQKLPFDESKSSPSMKLHSLSGAKTADTSIVPIAFPVVTSTLVITAHPGPGTKLHVSPLSGALATQRLLPSQAKAPASLTSLRVFRRVPVVLVRNMSDVQVQGCEYQRLFPLNAIPIGQYIAGNADLPWP